MIKPRKFHKLAQGSAFHDALTFGTESESGEESQRARLIVA